MSTDTHSSKSAAHRAAKKRDARQILIRGDEFRVVVWKPPEELGGDSAMTKIENIKTFIHPGPLTLEYGDTLIIKILDVGDSHAEAIAINKE